MHHRRKIPSPESGCETRHDSAFRGAAGSSISDGKYHSGWRNHRMNALTALLVASAVGAAPPEIDFAPGHPVAARDTRNLLLGPEVVFDAQADVARLARSVLVAD